MSADSGPPKDRDLVLVHSRTEDGGGVNVLRSRKKKLEAGVMRPLEEGKPIRGEVVSLTPHDECPALFYAETEVCAPQPDTDTEGPSKSGPAQVASEAYRKNWEAIYGVRSRRDLLN